MSNEILNNEWNVLFLDAKHPNWKVRNCLLLISNEWYNLNHLSSSRTKERWFIICWQQCQKHKTLFRKFTFMLSVQIRWVLICHRILEFETGRFLREGVLARGESYSGASLYQAIGRYTYSTFSTMLFGLDVSFSSCVRQRSPELTDEGAENWRHCYWIHKTWLETLTGLNGSMLTGIQKPRFKSYVCASC